MRDVTVREFLDYLLTQAAPCRLTALARPAACLTAALGDRPLVEVTAWELAKPLAEAGYDLAEYQAHRRDWEASYDDGVDVPWCNEDADELPHPVIERHADAGFGARGRVLELGCGVGANAAFLARRGAEVLGVDLSSRAIARANALFGDSGLAVEFRAQDAFELRAPPASFDFALDSWCLHHIPGHLMGPYIAHITALLKPHGELLSLTHSPKFNRTEGLLFMSTGVVGKALRYVLARDAESCFTQDELRNLLAPHYDILSIEHQYDYHIHADRHYSFVVRAKKR